MRYTARRWTRRLRAKRWRSSAWAVSGALRRILAVAGRPLDVGRVCGRYTPTRATKKCARDNRPHRSGARRLRSRRDLVRRHAKQFWRGTTPRRNETRRGRRHTVSLRHLLLQRRAAASGGALARWYQKRLSAAASEPITTEIAPAPEYYFAEDYHQQYLAKNPGGYCGTAAQASVAQSWSPQRLRLLFTQNYISETTSKSTPH